jgi:tRNA-2-methylthio-N6-dimethylallyladenosine synthase
VSNDGGADGVGRDPSGAPDGADHVLRTFHIRTFGCQMNEHDSERLAGALVADGLVATSDMESADVVVFNTCCIRENADNKFYGHLGNLKALRESRPEMQIAVGGCLAQMDGEKIRARAGHVDVVFGTHNLTDAPALLRRASSEGPLVEILDDPAPVGEPSAADQQTAALAAVRDLPYAAWVTIQMGCDNSCAYCIVPAVRGPEVSRPMGDLVAEVEELSRRGVTEVTLLGQNVNSYGRDITRRRPLFGDLLRAVGAVDGIRRVRFTSPHPKDLRPEVIAAMGETPEVCTHLHLPLQSGSDATLAAMRRGYTAERYLERLRAARAAVEDLAVTTDLIVGFPGETEADFERTLEVVAEAEFDSAYTFVFSPRPGTRAAGMEDRFLGVEVTAERMERLRSVVERSALRRHRARVGRVEEVVVEGPSKRDPAVMTGRTAQNKLVHFAAPPGRPPASGSYALVTVTDAARHHLTGDLVEVTARPSYRVRIPVTAG